MAYHYPGQGPGRSGGRSRSQPSNPGGDGEGPRGVRARARSTLEATRSTLSGLPRVMALVWGASRTHTLILASVTILAGLVPAAQALTARLLINAVVRAILIHARHLPDRMALPLTLPWVTPVMTVTGVVIVLAVLQLVITAVSSLLQTLSNISQQLLQERVSMRVQLLIMERAAGLDLTFSRTPIPTTRCSRRSGKQPRARSRWSRAPSGWSAPRSPS